MNGQVIKDDIPITSLEDWEHRIHEFKSSLTDDEKRSANERDFQQFLSMLNFPGGRTEDRLLGPTRVHGDPIVSNVANLYLGKVISEASH